MAEPRVSGTTYTSSTTEPDDGAPVNYTPVVQALSRIDPALAQVVTAQLDKLTRGPQPGVAVTQWDRSLANTKALSDRQRAELLQLATDAVAEQRLSYVTRDADGFTLHQRAFADALGKIDPLMGRLYRTDVRSEQEESSGIKPDASGFTPSQRHLFEELRKVDPFEAGDFALSVRAMRQADRGAPVDEQGLTSEQRELFMLHLKMDPRSAELYLETGDPTVLGGAAALGGTRMPRDRFVDPFTSGQRTSLKPDDGTKPLQSDAPVIPALSLNKTYQG